MARPPLPRFRADVRIAVEFGAADLEDAEARLEQLLANLRPRLEAAVRGARVGASTALYVDAPTDPAAV